MARHHRSIGNVARILAELAIKSRHRLHDFAIGSAAIRSQMYAAALSDAPRRDSALDKEGGWFLTGPHLESTHDTVLIGSGPINLLEALVLSRAGKKCLVVETRNQLGGAWGAVSYPGLPPIESACHIWEADPRIYEFIKQLLNVTLCKLSPQPQIRYGFLRVPYEWSVLRDLVRGRFRNTLSMLKRIPIGPKTYLYPRGGSVELIDRFSLALTQAKVQVELNSEVESIDLRSHQPVVRLRDRQVQCQEVVMTKFAGVGCIVGRDGTEHRPSRVEQRFVHYHLLYDDPSPHRFSYVRLIDHPLIHRVSDITSQLAHYEDFDLGRRKIIVVGIHRNTRTELGELELLDLIQRTLRDERLIGPDGRCAEYHRVEFIRRPYSGATRDVFLDSPLRWLTCDDFVVGVSRNLQRWNESLNRTKDSLPEETPAAHR